MTKQTAAQKADTLAAWDTYKVQLAAGWVHVPNLCAVCGRGLGRALVPPERKHTAVSTGTCAYCN